MSDKRLKKACFEPSKPNACEELVDQCEEVSNAEQLASLPVTPAKQATPFVDAAKANEKPTKARQVNSDDPEWASLMGDKTPYKPRSLLEIVEHPWGGRPEYRSQDELDADKAFWDKTRREKKLVNDSKSAGSLGGAPVMAGHGMAGTKAEPGEPVDEFGVPTRVMRDVRAGQLAGDTVMLGAETKGAPKPDMPVELPPTTHLPVQ